MKVITYSKHEQNCSEGEAAISCVSSAKLVEQNNMLLYVGTVHNLIGYNFPRNKQTLEIKKLEWRHKVPMVERACFITTELRADITQ